MKQVITRVGDIKELLKSVKDDDFMYAEVSEYGGVSICIEECEKNDEFYIINKPIIVPPMTNGFASDFIVKYE